MTDTATGLVVGGGSIGRRHAQNLRELGVEVVVADPNEEARNQLEDELNVATFSDIADALDSVSPDIAVICSPNNLHVELATEVARAGCHLFIEKPLSDKMDGIDTLEAVVSENNLITLVGCNFRFHPEIKKIHRLIKQGAVGPVTAARIEGGSYLPEWFPDSDYRESYSAREELGGGVILDYIHEINYARWFFDEFETVSAIAGQHTHLDIETNDVAGILAKTTSDTVCEFHLDYVQREYSRSCHIIGERGTIRWSYPDGCVEWYMTDRDEWQTFHRPDNWKWNDNFVDEMNHFLNCVEAGEQSICPVDCGRRDLRVALAARESSERGRHVAIEYSSE